MSTHGRGWGDGGTYRLRADEENNVNEKRFAYRLMYKMLM
jgi:hypothetical protein